MVILEGPDGSGKTTLAKQICGQFDLSYTRYSGLSSETGPDTGIWDWWDEQIRAQLVKNVYDRCAYVSEIPYQLVMKGRPLVADRERMYRGIVNLYLADFLLIFCIPPWETSKNIVSSQAERLKGVTEEDLEKVHWAYSSIHAMWENAFVGNVLLYDFTNHKEDFVMKKVEGYLDRRGR